MESEIYSVTFSAETIQCSPHKALLKLGWTNGPVLNGSGHYFCQTIKFRLGNRTFP